MEIQLNQIIFQLINFSVVVGALAYLLYRPIIKILEERSEKILKGQKAAEKSIAEAEKIDQLKDEAVKNGQKEANKIITDAKVKAKEQASQIKKDAKEEGKQIIEKMKKDFDQEKAKQLKMMEKEFHSAVISVSEKVIAQSLTDKKHTQLIDQELKTLLKSI